MRTQPVVYNRFTGQYEHPTPHCDYCGQKVHQNLWVVKWNAGEYPGHVEDVYISYHRSCWEWKGVNLQSDTN